MTVMGIALWRDRATISMGIVASDGNGWWNLAVCIRRTSMAAEEAAGSSGTPLSKTAPD
jgi:hypothetical protein